MSDLAEMYADFKQWLGLKDAPLDAMVLQAGWNPRAVAARIVACVNAMKGIADPAAFVAAALAAGVKP